MRFDGDHLLKRLNPTVRPCGPEFVPVRHSSVEELDFETLVRMAQRGELASGRAVSNASTHELTREQREKVSTACDAFEAAGMVRGLVMFGEATFLLEVESRKLETIAASLNPGEIEKLDGIIQLEAPANITPKPRAGLAEVPQLPPGIHAQLQRKGV